MADLTTPNIYDLTQEGEELSYPLAVVKCPRGVAIFKDSSGYATPTWANAAANGFLGISKGDVDNSASGAAAGDKSVVVKRKRLVQFDTTDTLTAASVGTDVYLVDNHTVTAAAGSPSVYAGKIAKFIDASTCLVDISRACASADFAL